MFIDVCFSEEFCEKIKKKESETKIRHSIWNTEPIIVLFS